jgi:hypothetical protein
MFPRLTQESTTVTYDVKVHLAQGQQGNVVNAAGQIYDGV